MDEIFIHGMGDRFAHPDIGQRAFGGVHRQPIKWTNAAVAFVGDGQCVDLFQPVDNAWQRLESAHMDFAVLISDGPRGRIGDDPHDNFVEIGSAFDEKVIKTLEDHMLARFIFHQFEWPRANHVFGIAGMGFRILSIAIDMFWNDSHQLT